jgi:heme-degrading monooxygenase HmoA
MPQIQIGKQPITQIIIIESEPEKQAEALSIMTERARFMAHQPGFISISLHRSLDGRRIVNYVQWESPDLLRAAHQSPEFRKALESVRKADRRDRSPSVRGRRNPRWWTMRRASPFGECRKPWPRQVPQTNFSITVASPLKVSSGNRGYT